jgi:hypothetical protein
MIRCTSDCRPKYVRWSESRVNDCGLEGVRRTTMDGIIDLPGRHLLDRQALEELFDEVLDPFHCFSVSKISPPRDADARPVSVQELDSGSLESGEDLGEGLAARGGGAALEIGNRLLGDAGLPHEVFLRPGEEGSGGAALRGGEGH